MPKLIVTNGDVAVERLKEADMSGQILPWQDMLHDGPVPSSDVLDEVSDIRATFLSEALGLPLDEVRANFARRDGVLDIHPAYAEVELWFEHDLYDQLQLIQLLHYFSNQPERMGLFLVQAQDYLGLLEVSDIRALGKSRKPVSQIQLETGRSAWEAFTAPTPTALAGFATTPHACLPYLAPAFRRLLAELPAPHSGLSLTEERILQQLLEGPRKVAHVFAAVNAMDEDAQFLADLPFFLRLDGLAFTHEPLVTGLPFSCNECGSMAFEQGEKSQAEMAYRAYAGAEISLTEAGLAALRGKFDHACQNSIERAIGGFRLMPGAMWRYDRARSELVSPN
ncbi:hypothetical protein ACT6QG_01375 [Xanthobacter sp. TB0136]|uniref:hypothetical protein n=1 Tax=Xanthobacter sp. TB0136 TaxID=3459177 RepID=UPI00403A5E98